MKISKITIKSLFGIKEWSGDGKNIELVGDNGTGKHPLLMQSDMPLPTHQTVSTLSKRRDRGRDFH